MVAVARSDEAVSCGSARRSRGWLRRGRSSRGLSTPTANVLPICTGMPHPELPCYPCPYDASCCAYGTTLTDEEARMLEADQGTGLAYRTRWGEWRTRVRNGRC